MMFLIAITDESRNQREGGVGVGKPKWIKDVCCFVSGFSDEDTTHEGQILGASLISSQ